MCFVFSHNHTINYHVMYSLIYNSDNKWPAKRKSTFMYVRDQSQTCTKQQPHTQAPAYKTTK